MGSGQSSIDKITELRRQYGQLKYEQNDIKQRLDKLDIDRAMIDQCFQKQQTDLKNMIDELKGRLRELKHEYTVSKYKIDEDQQELTQRIQELNQSVTEIKVSELRVRNNSFIKKQKH